MNPEIAQRIVAVQEAAGQDEQYRTLLEEYRTLDRQFLEILPTLTKAQCDTVTDYIGLIAQMHRRMLEIACSADKNVEKSGEFL